MQHELIHTDANPFKPRPTEPYFMEDVFALPKSIDSPAPTSTCDGYRNHQFLSCLTHPNEWAQCNWARIWFQCILLVSREITQVPSYEPPADTTDEIARDISMVKYFMGCLSSHNNQARIEQGGSSETPGLEQTFKALDNLIDNIYYMLIAFALLRAKQRLEGTEVAPAHLQSFHQLPLTITHRPTYHFLAAYLVAGIRGLLLIPSDQKKFAISQSLELMVLVARANQLQPKVIEEPIWKRTNAYIVKLIQDCFFNPTLISGTQVSRVTLAKCLVLDFSNHWLDCNTSENNEPVFNLPRKSHVSTPSIQSL